MPSWAGTPQLQRDGLCNPGTLDSLVACRGRGNVPDKPGDCIVGKVSGEVQGVKSKAWGEVSTYTVTFWPALPISAATACSPEVEEPWRILLLVGDYT